MNLQLYIRVKRLLLLYFSVILLASCSGSGGTEVPVIDLPFSYTIGASSLEISSASGGVVYASPGAFGAHFLPFSGDLLGDAKSNFMTFYARSARDLTELVGDGNGRCDENETCGFWGGLSGEVIRQQTPIYKAPVDATLIRVTLNDGANSSYFGSPQHWDIEFQYGSHYTQRIGHIASIAPDLRKKILDATGIDTDAAIYPGQRTHLVTNGKIPLNAGDELAFPQVFAKEVNGFPGYYTAYGRNSQQVPWAQMEFPIVDHKKSSEVCIFNLMDTSKRVAIQTVMDNDMLTPDSPRYSLYANQKWLWGAEAMLCPAHAPGSSKDFSSIHTRLGGWTERPTATSSVDEWFAIVPIIKTSAVYDASNYDSASVSHVVARYPGPGFPAIKFTMPDMSEVDVYLPSGEVLEETVDALLIKWRDIAGTDVYQYATFLLDIKGLKIKWGDIVAVRDEATKPVLNVNEACDGDIVTCYDHEARL
ncbi:MAG: hypothetical protein DRQ44_04805 [Gammaproteobacteria bacterium]|nr:MAG: hypothetical protein DRQ44_04805 [Gammaproteobacteria bacterium]